MIWLVLVAAAVGAGWLLGHGDAAANVRAAAAAAPRDLLVVLQGVTLGWCGRDRIRLRRTYASPTLAYLGKLLGFAGLAGAATFAASPVAWGPAWLDAFAASTALGAGVWIGNLPARL
jgi:hypothetical protein